MKYLPIDSNLFVKNRKKLTSRLKLNSLVIVNSNDEMPQNGDLDFQFRQNSDIFYLSGIDQEKSILTLCPDHPNERLREVLFLVKTNKELETWYGHKYTIEEAEKTSGIKTIKWLDSFDSILLDLAVDSDNIYMNTNENLRFSSAVPYRDLRFIEQMKSKFPLHNYNRLAPEVTALRTVKEPEEIALMKQACRITEKTFKRLLKFVRPGVMEYEIEAEMIHEFIRNRASRHAFSPIIASGKNACILHYVDNNQKCKDGDLVLIDFGAEYANYASDSTRTIPVSGKFSPRQREVYEAVLSVMKQAIQLLVPGTTINKYHKKVCDIMEKELINLGLITTEEVAKEAPDAEIVDRALFKYYMHGTSHFIGLDTHDVGTKDTEMKPGMIFSCEPGIYIAEEGIGIRLEDDILITENGPINLFENHPIEPDDIEALMAG